MSNNTRFEIRVGLCSHVVEYCEDNGLTFFHGEGASETEALQALFDVIRANAVFRRVFANGQRIFAEDVETFPVNILPETHGLIVTNEERHGSAYRRNRKFFLVPRSLVTVVRRGEHEQIEISNDPVLMHHDRDDDGYQLLLPEGSMELVGGTWTAWVSESEENEDPEDRNPCPRW